MPVFPVLPLHEQKWLLNTLSGHADGTKIKYGSIIPGGYQLKNSCIKLKYDVYMLARDGLGAGSEARVKYVKSLSSNVVYVVKIIRSSLYAKVQKEVDILNDLGFYHEGLTKTNYFIPKHYIVMLDAGLSLEQYLKKHPDLSRDEQFNLAIQLCWSVHRFHAGIASRTGTAYAHRDIKPANIAIKNNVLRLIDVELSANNPNQLPMDFNGTPAYQPNYESYVRKKHCLKALDVFSLKRVMYMPDKMICRFGYREHPEHFGLVMLFTRAQLVIEGLLEYFDTSAQNVEQLLLMDSDFQGDPVCLGGLLVLARYMLRDRYDWVLKSPTLSHAVLGMYFANRDNPDEHFTCTLSTTINAHHLSLVSPRCKKLATQMKLRAFVMIAGIDKDIDEAIKTPALLASLNASSIHIRKAAVLLWRNDFRETSFFHRLNRDEALAQDIIGWIFNGYWDGVRNALRPALRPLVLRESHQQRFFPLAPGGTASVVKKGVGNSGPVHLPSLVESTKQNKVPSSRI